MSSDCGDQGGDVDEARTMSSDCGDQGGDVDDIEDVVGEHDVGPQDRVAKSRVLPKRFVVSPIEPRVLASQAVRCWLHRPSCAGRIGSRVFGHIKCHVPPKRFV